MEVPTQPDDQIMADIDNANIPDKIERPEVQSVPRLDMGNLLVPPVLNEPIPVKKPTHVVDYDQILAPVKIVVTLKGQLPPLDMEKNFEAIHTTAENLPDLESLFRENKPPFKPDTEISMFMKHIPKQQDLDRFVNYLSNTYKE